MEWRPARWLVRLPLLIFSCTIKSRSSLLAPAHPGGPGKRAVKRSRVCVFGTIRVSWCKRKSSGVFVAREDNRSRHTDHPDGCHSIWPNQWPFSIIPHFYGRCASCHNPPNLSWLGRGTKYAALHTQWVGYSIYTSRLQYWYNIHSLLHQQYMMLYQ